MQQSFYCRSYCLLNMLWAPLCPSSGAQEYYTEVAACGISCCGFSSCWSGVELRVMCPVCRMLVYILTNLDNRLNTTINIIKTSCTRVGTLIVATIYLQLIQNRYMFPSFTVLQCSHQHCVQPAASDVEVIGYL